MLILAIFTPLSTFAAIFIPAPLAILFYKGQWQRAVGYAVFAMLGLFLLGAWIAPVLLLIAVTVTGYILSIGLKNNTLAQSVVYATLVIIAFLLMMLLLLKVSGIFIWPFMAQQIDQALKTELQLGVGSESFKSIEDQVLGQIRLNLPAIFVIMAAVAALSNAAVLRVALIKAGKHNESFFRRLRMPKMIAPLFLVSFIGIQVGSGSMYLLIWQLVNNLLIITTFLLSLQTLSLLWWMFGSTKLRLLKWFAAAVFAIVPLIGYVYVIIGLLDVVLDLRTRLKLRK